MILLGWSEEEYIDAFLNWYYGLSIPTLLRLEQNKPASSPLQRYLRHYFSDIEKLTNQCTSQEESGTYLFTGSHALSQLFARNRGEAKLVHSYFLTGQCRLAEMERAKEMESKTLGKITAVGAGVKWEMLQLCILHTIYLSVRTKALFHLSVVS